MTEHDRNLLKLTPALVAEREKLEEVFEQTSVPLCLLEGPDHRYTFANSSYLKLFSLNRTPVGRVLKDVFPEAVDQGFGDLLDKVYRTGERFTGVEIPFERARGDGEFELIYVDFTYAAKRNARNQIEGVLVATVDVTEKVLARQKIERSEAHLNLLVDALPQMVFLADAAGNVTRFNQRWYEYIGKVEGTEGWGWINHPVHHPDDLDRTVARWAEAILTGNPYEIEYRLRRHDGAYRWHLGRATPIRDANGQVVQWFGTNTDIDDIRRMQAKLSVADERLNVALTTANIGFWDYDVVSGHVSLSDTLMQQWGIDPTTFRNTLDECMAKIHPEDRARVGDQIGASLAHATPYDVEYRVVRPDGVTLLMNAKGQAFANQDGSPRRLTGITMDVTERRRFEAEIKESRDEAERANGAKSAFLANMSHEIRTPLGAIMGFSDLASNPGLSEATLHAYLAVIRRNSEQVLRIIDDILDLAKVEAGRVATERIEFSLPEFLSEFSSLMSFRAREHGITFETIADSHLPETIIGDPTRLRQILTNAVGNAIKFTSYGWVRLNVEILDRTLRLTITDTGRGIAPEQAENLFQAFVQADSSTTRKFGGTGLGLVLTKRLCHLFGGDYALAWSELGHGSRFVATLQIEVPPGVAIVPPERFVLKGVTAAPREVPRDQLAGLRVLLVEDSPDNQMLFEILLGQQGVVLDIANDGVEGVEKAEAGQHDVVLMDIQMPRMDGHAAARRLRARGFGKPIIALTAHAMKDEAERATRSGFSGYVSKPVQKDQLIATLRNSVERTH